MPVVDTKQLENLLEKGHINAITLDSNIFIGRNKQVQLDWPSHMILAGLRNKQIEFILSGTIRKELLKHLQDNYETAFRDVKNSIRSALDAFGTKEPTLKNLLDQISGGSSATDAASKRLERFIRDTNCKVLEDELHIDIASINNDYFDINPPFEDRKDKKCEYPDAIALNAISGVAKKRNMGILVVSRDNGWEKYCNNSTSNLFCLKRLDHALDLVSKVPSDLRKVIKDWFADGNEGRDYLLGSLRKNVEEIYFDAFGNASFGHMTAYALMGELQNIDWLGNVYIIETEYDMNHNCFSVTVSLDLTLNVKVPIELSFFVWDTTDNDSISMGGREDDYEEELSVTTYTKIEIFDLDCEEEEIRLVNSELDIKNYEIDLGEVDVFTPEDCD